MRCGPSWPGLDRAMLASAVALGKAETCPRRSSRCVDVVALVRDEDLTGDMTDVLLANSQLQRAVTTCGPLIVAAPKDEAARVVTSLTSLRSTFPKSLDDARRRDRAEMVLFAFGKGGDPSRPYACERATAFAAGEGPGGKPLTRGDRLDLEKAWQTAHAERDVPDPKFEEAFTLSLTAARPLDRARPRSVSREGQSVVMPAHATVTERAGCDGALIVCVPQASETSLARRGAERRRRGSPSPTAPRGAGRPRGGGGDTVEGRERRDGDGRRPRRRRGR